MKKFLLSIVCCLLACVSIHAEEITFNFNELYGSTTTDASTKTVNGITISYAKNGASNVPAFNKDGTLRLYYGSGGNGCSATFTTDGTKKIIGAVITAKSNYTPTVKYSVDGGNLTSGTWSSTTMTISDISASNTLMIQNANTSNTQLRITEIVLTVESNSSGATKETQTLAFSEDNISINEGETFTAPTLTGAQTTVTYSSSNTSVATVDKNTGDITIVGTGTTIITATAEGTNEYYEASAQYTLTVIADPSNGGTVTFDFTDPVSLGLAVPAVSDGTRIDNAVISGAVTMTATHGTEATRIWKSTSGKMDLRIYKNGGSITFAVPDGYEITSITYTGDTKPTNWIGSAQSVTVEATATLKISTATITYARVYPLNISAAGYATFTSDKNYIIPAGVEGGIVTVEGTTANVNYVYTEGDIVPANTGLLMKGAQGEYKMYATTQEATEVYAENLLKGALTNEVITAPAGSLLYIFANDSESGLGFYWQKNSNNGQQVQNMAGKAYLQVPTTSAVKGFRLNLGDTTGITAVESTLGNAPVYTLSGVRVNGSINNLPAGIYIVGGKKVYVK